MPYIPYAKRKTDNKVINSGYIPYSQRKDIPKPVTPEPKGISVIDKPYTGKLNVISQPTQLPKLNVVQSQPTQTLKVQPKPTQSILRQEPKINVIGPEKQPDVITKKTGDEFTLNLSPQKKKDLNIVKDIFKFFPIALYKTYLTGKVAVQQKMGVPTEKISVEEAPSPGSLMSRLTGGTAMSPFFISDIKNNNRLVSDISSDPKLSFAQKEFSDYGEGVKIAESLGYEANSTQAKSFGLGLIALNALDLTDPLGLKSPIKKAITNGIRKAGQEFGGELVEKTVKKIAQEELEKAAKVGEKEVRKLIVSTIEQTRKELPPLPKIGSKVKTPTKFEQKVLGIPEQKVVTKPESALLKSQIRAEARTAKVVSKNVRKETRENILQTLATKQAEVTAVRKNIIDYIKESLPTNVRGNFLSVINKARTQTDLTKAFVRVDSKVQDVERKNLITETKKIISEITNQKNISVDYKKRVKEIQSKIELPTHQQKTLDTLQKTKKALEEKILKGEPVIIPVKLQEKLNILQKTQATELSNERLRSLYDELDLIKKLGITKQKARQTIYANQKAGYVAKLTQAVREGKLKPITTRELAIRKPGQKLSLADKAKNIVKDILNKAQRIDKSITPMDAIFKFGMGPEAHKIFKENLDIKYGSFLNKLDDVINRFQTEIKNLNITEDSFERIGIHAARVQDGGKEKLLQLGLTESEVSEIVLTKNETALYNWMRKELDTIGDEVSEILRVHYNKELPRVKNYFSFFTDFEKMSDTEVAERFMSVPEFQARTKQVGQGFTKERTGGQQKIKLNAAEIFERHLNNATYFTEMGPEIRKLFEVANQEGMENVLGDYGKNITLDWLDLMARKGGMAGEQKVWIADTLRKNFGLAQLGLNLSSALVQTTALFDGAAQIGTYAFRGLGDISSNSSIRKFVVDNMPEVRKRVGDDRAFNELFKSKIGRFAQKVGYGPLQAVDKITASGVAWGAYLKKLKELGVPLDLSKPNQEALTYAQQILRTTQASSFFKDQPLAVSRGALTGNKSIDRAILQFQTFMLTRWSQIRNNLPASIRNKKPEEAIRMVTWLTAALFAEELIRRGVRKGTNEIMGNDKEEYNTFGESVILNSLQTIPFLSQGMSMTIYGGSPVPSLSVTDTAFKFGKARNPETRLKYGVETFGTLLGIPGTKQFSKILPTTKKESKSSPLPTLPSLPKLPTLPKIK